MKRLAAALGLLAVGVTVAFASGLAGAAPDPPATGADAAAIRVLPTGQQPVAGAEVVGPPGASTDVSGFSYPDDGSVVRLGSASGYGVPGSIVRHALDSDGGLATSAVLGMIRRAGCHAKPSRPVAWTSAPRKASSRHRARF